ncbi:efflux RND transporter permease subunit [Bauldia sp.]|uniref:efflux RND transporter permease subunit n=1 Tax=Bauldia sp. TaxID=2575872 RepID=UPI003BADBDB9
MNLIRAAIDRPIAVVAAVMMIVMFGWVSLQTIPIQLVPDVNRPIITIETNWPGAAPAEIEREIINRQEDALTGLEGLEEIISSSRNGQGEITLTFNIATDMDRSLLLVANRLDRVSGYPEEADEPTLAMSEDEGGNAIAWFVLTRAEGIDRPIHTYGDFVEDVIVDRLERVRGVAGSGFFGGTEREMQVVVDPDRLAQYGLTVSQVLGALRAANISLSAGDVDEGKRRYIVRTDGDFSTLDEVGAVLIRSDQAEATGTVSRVTVGDIADVSFAFKQPEATIRYLGQPALVVNLQRETGANVIEVMDGVREVIAELESGLIPDELIFKQIYDETDYINSSIALVQQNIVVGGALAALMLLLFLRSGRATLVVSLAIPVSVVGSFVAMAMLGRSINVVSLAGIAFAVGMVVDAAIVVLENIFRLRQSGMSAREAAYQGTQQVWGAVLVSALTTVMVFIPILVMELEVGQLFRDIGVAISVSVLLSLLVAVTVIPALASRLLAREGVGDPSRQLKLPVIDWCAHAFSRLIQGFTTVVVRSRALALLVVAAVTAGAVAFTWALLPDLEYLPSGNRNFVVGFLLPPSGYNLDASTEIALGIEGAVRPLWVDDNGERVADQSTLPPFMQGMPGINNFFFVTTTTGFNFVGGSADDEQRAGEILPAFFAAVGQQPGTRGFFFQASLFGQGIGGSRSIDLDVSGGDLEVILGVALQAFISLNQAIPGAQARPQPGLTLGAPEVRVTPDPVRLSDNGVTAAELASTVDLFNDGIRVAEITVDGERIDLTMRGPVGGIETTQGIAGIPVVTDSGTIVPVDALATVDVTSGPTEIRHRDRTRTVTLTMSPPNEMALETAIRIIRDQVIQPLQDQGLPPGVSMRVSGTADQLEQTWNEMVLDLVMAIIIVYLVMAILFESFWYPLIILVAVPVAAAGGVGGLAALNLANIDQKLDMLTLLGFVILIGIVVNNAILLVHQSLYNLRTEGMEPGEAIREATRNRIRPIFMSTLTSIFGMLPLVVVPGAGSELYRGLGSVVVGGLSASAILTLLIVPPLMSIFMTTIEGHSRRGAKTTPSPEPAE